MVRPHPLFPPPPDPQIKIWRYMDFTKFVSLLHRRELYFSRADLLDDRFEGSYPKGNKAVRQALRLELEAQAVPNPDAMMRSMAEVRKSVTNWTYLNCWHVAECESAAMWKLYTHTTEAVAVRSTYQRLREVVPESVLIGRVQYIDFDRDLIPETNLLYPFLYKRLSFSHEQELRALILSVPHTDGKIDRTPGVQAPGKQISVQMDTLVERAYVAPGAPPWFLELVRDVAAKYELNKEVVQSSLDSDPFF